MEPGLDALGLRCPAFFVAKAHSGQGPPGEAGDPSEPLGIAPEDDAQLVYICYQDLGLGPRW